MQHVSLLEDLTGRQTAAKKKKNTHLLTSMALEYVKEGKNCCSFCSFVLVCARMAKPLKKAKPHI